MAGRRLLKLAAPRSSRSLGDRGPGRMGRGLHVRGQRPEAREEAPRQPTRRSSYPRGLILRRGRGETLLFAGALWSLVLRPAVG